MATVTINGHTYSDDSNPTTGLAGGGHRTRFIPLIQDVVAVTAGVSGSSTVYGPASATDNALMRFDGTTGKLAQNSTGYLSDIGVLSIESTSSSAPMVSMTNSSNDASGPFILTYESRGANTASAVGDSLGSWQCYGFDGTNYRSGALIRARSTGEVTASGTPACVEISTSDGSALTTRMVINSDGSVVIGSVATFNSNNNSASIGGATFNSNGSVTLGGATFNANNVVTFGSTITFDSDGSIRLGNNSKFDSGGKLMLGSIVDDASGDMVQVTGNAGVTGYTRLGTGAPYIRQKKLTGTSPAAEGNSVGIAHGLTASKILDVTASIQDSAAAVYRQPGNRAVAECEYYLSWNSTNVIVDLSSTNSGYLLSRPVKILITYEV